MIHSLDQVLSRIDEQTKIVPGHGPLAARADLEDYRDMLLQVRQRVKGLISAGKTIDQAVAAGPTKDYDSRWGGGYLTPEIFTRMVFSSLADVSATR
jgi:cyclase